MDHASSPLPSLPDAFSRRRAIFGAAAIATTPVLPAFAEPSPDAHLIDLIARHAVALAAYNHADNAVAEPLKRFHDQEPAKPDALRWRGLGDLGPIPKESEPLPNGRYRMWWDHGAVAGLRADEDQVCSWFDGPESCFSIRRPDPQKIERRAEILAAWDGWIAERRALMDRVGLTGANDKIDATAEVLDTVDDEILATAPTTLAGFVAKARWIAAQNRIDGFGEVMVRDLCGAHADV